MIPPRVTPSSQWCEIVPKGIASHGLWGMIFQKKQSAACGGNESFVIELSGQSAKTLVMDIASKNPHDKSHFAAVEVLKNLGVKVKRCSLSLGIDGLPQAELELTNQGADNSLKFPPDQVIGFVIAHQAPFRATQEFIDFARRSRLSSENFSVLVSERIRSTDSRSVRWK
jgi:hypothetical protein